ncbi:MAG TPA: hypothetical protein VF533_14505 [Solirubrobacteraceae bacterium]
MIERGLRRAMPDGLRAWALAGSPEGRYLAIHVADPLTRRVLRRMAARAAAQDTRRAPAQAVVAVGAERLYVFGLGDVQRAGGAEEGAPAPALELALGDVSVEVATGVLWRRLRLRAAGLTCTLFLNMLGAGRKRPRALLAALAGART